MNTEQQSTQRRAKSPSKALRALKYPAGSAPRPNSTATAKNLLLGIVLSLPLLCAPRILAASDSPLLWRGSLETDQRLMLQDEHEWAWNESRLDLSLEKRSSQMRVLGNVWLRHLGPSVADSSQDLYSKDQIRPWNLDIRELYLEVHGFLSDKLDLKVGRQRIAWGTADRFNPTDNLNPPDLEDLLDFGRANGSDALQLQWYFSHQSNLQLVYIPRFQPANMPLGPFSDLFALDFVLHTLTGDILIPIEDKRVSLPRNNLAEGSTLAARFSSFVFNTDLSVSYVYGRDFLPLPHSIHIQMDPNSGEFHSSAELVFPRQHVIGADMAGSIGRVGVWAEAGLFIPEKEMRTEVVMEDLDWHQEVVALEKESFVKFVVGSDYTFGRGTYVNIQYLRGFFHEGGRDGLNDYLILQTEKEVLRYNLRIQPLAGGVTITDWDDAKNNYAWFYKPEISYQGVENLDISLGAFFSRGKGDHLLAGLNDNNMLRMRLIASF